VAIMRFHGMCSDSYISVGTLNFRLNKLPSSLAHSCPAKPVFLLLLLRSSLPSRLWMYYHNARPTFHWTLVERSLFLSDSRTISASRICSAYRYSYIFSLSHSHFDIDFTSRTSHRCISRFNVLANYSMFVSIHLCND